MKAFFKPNQLTYSLFAVYLIALYWIIVLKFNISAYHDRVQRTINWIPYREFIRYGNLDLPETLLNIFIFIPFGLYLGVLVEKWNFGKKVLLFFSLSFLLEVSQFVLKVGAFDVTDLINNTIGGVMGLIIYTWLVMAFKSRIKTQKIINITALIGTVLIISFLMFLKINDLWIFRMNTIRTVSEL